MIDDLTEVIKNHNLSNERIMKWRRFKVPGAKRDANLPQREKRPIDGVRLPATPLRCSTVGGEHIFSMASSRSRRGRGIFGAPLTIRRMGPN